MKEPDDFDWQALADEHEREGKQRKVQRQRQVAVWLVVLALVLFSVLTWIGSLIPTI